MYSTLTTHRHKQKFITLPLHLLLPLIFPGWCLPYNTPVVVSQHIRTPIFHRPSLGRPIHIKSSRI